MLVGRRFVSSCLLSPVLDVVVMEEGIVLRALTKSLLKEVVGTAEVDCDRVYEFILLVIVPSLSSRAESI